jgi:hypothetical protein
VFGRRTRYIDPMVPFGIQAVSYSATNPRQCRRTPIRIHADLTAGSPEDSTHRPSVPPLAARHTHLALPGPAR